MRGAHELARELGRVDAFEREAEHETVASVTRAQRQPQGCDIELPAQMLERPVVFRDRADTQRGETCFRPQFDHDLFDRAETSGRGHAGESRNERATGTRCAMSLVVLGQRFARPVLVVDDDEATRSAERAVLTEDGFRVIEARDGAEAMRVIQNDPPAVVVLDIQMPGVDGPSFARELRLALRRVPLVILTGVDDPKHEADRCNAEAYLSKPFDALELVKIVRRLAM